MIGLAALLVLVEEGDSDMEMSNFAKTIFERTYAHDTADGKETWEQTAHRVTKTVMKAVGVDMRQSLAKEIREAIVSRKFIPAGRYLYASGRPLHQVNNCLLLRAHDSREGWSELMAKASKALMTGAGIGVNYSSVRHEGAVIRKSGGVASGPIPLMQMVNECGRGVMQGGVRRSAIWAGLKWTHPDVFKFITVKNWPQEIHNLKSKDFAFPATLDHTNISVGLDDEFFEAYNDDEHPQYSLAHNVYWAVIEQMMRTGEPGFYVDTGKNAGEDLRNACCEVTSRDSDDICNLGHVNLARIESIDELKGVVELGISFLLAGSIYTDLPYSDVDKILSKNRRLGLGLMGIHDWLLKRGKKYGPDEELGQWLKAYSKSGKYANAYADEWSMSRPKKTRAIAPTGTTSIVAETTGGIEPVFCVAYKRRYLKGSNYCYQYVIDPCAKRLIDQGIDPNLIEDAYMLARNVERRVAFQAWVQQYIDHAISSTINLPAWGTEFNNKDLVRSFGATLFRYLPQLRGITTYPDGSRGGQPLNPVPYEEAKDQEGVEIVEEQQNVCDLRGGSCGD
jgi:ribonucleoside-diphosphate reductase alpha chain